MLHNISFAPVKNNVINDSKLPPVTQSSFGVSFRDILAGSKQNNIAPAILLGSQRDKIMDAIAQARAFTPPAFSAPPKEPFNIRTFYSMPPEEVSALRKELTEELNNNLSLFGMTAAGVYEYIENRYKEVFGEDFLIAQNLQGNLCGSLLSDEAKETTNYAYIQIGIDFNIAIGNHVGKHLDMNTSTADINRERLYGNMSDREIMDTVMAKYPQPMTIRSLALLESELVSVGLNYLGVGKYANAVTLHADECVTKGNMPSWEELERRWNKVIDKPADIQHLATFLNPTLGDRQEMRRPGVFQRVMQTVEMLVKLGAVLGPDGLFVEPKKSVFVELDVKLGAPDDSDDLVDEFLKDLEKHDKTLSENKEQLDKNRELKEVSEKYSSYSANFYNTNHLPPVKGGLTSAEG
ncbi:MAG: hypothetical protein FWD44_05085 [Oscillospiraceae bacterium]|nr:hypothetical protein [Oscillospiraceae bacterium]